MSDSGEVINGSINDLEAVEIKLNSVDTEELDDNQRNLLAEQINQVSLDLIRLRTAEIEALSDEFIAQQDDLSERTSNLKVTLDNVYDAIAIIGVVSQALVTITNIVSLI